MPTTMTKDKLIQFSKDNWNRIPEDVREECLKVLRAYLTEEVIDDWKANGIGNKEGNWFHMGGGMMVRNRLRRVLSDDALPTVMYSGPEYGSGYEAHNWDDFYMGALHELVYGKSDGSPAK